MKIQLPKHLKLTEKEKKEIDENLEHYARTFLRGLFFFLTVPMTIHRIIRRKNDNTKRNN